MADKLITNLDNPDTQNIVKQQEIVITDKDKEDFYKSFLSDQPFIQEMTLFGDRLKVTFKTLSLEENSQIFKQVKLDQQAGQQDLDDDYIIKISSYRLGLSLIKVNGEDFHPEIDESKLKLNEKKDTTLVKERAKLFTEWPIFKLHGVLEAFRNFEKKILQLSNGVLDPNFWIAAK